LFRLKVARSAAEIAHLSSVWDSLWTSETSLFQSHRWNRLAAEVFADREEPHFIFAENDNGAAIIPAVIELHSRTISFAGERLFDYRDYLARGDPGALMQAWHELVALDLPMSVTAICRTDGPIWNRIPKAFFSRAPRLERQSMSPDEFVHRHSRAFTRLRKLQRMGLSIGQYSGDSPVVRRIYERRAQQSSEGELFHDPRRVEFMIAACRAEGTRCEIFTLEHGSTLAAALLTFRDGAFRRFYTIYYDHAWKRYSPGVSLLFEISRRSLEEELSFDFLTGEQGYKARIAQSAQDLFRVNASARELRDVIISAAIKRAA
jgi:CelD/BcsL family acetyltransferase involved in cellulose biosynthesis